MMRVRAAAITAVLTSLLSACGAADRVEGTRAEAPSAPKDPQTSLSCQGQPVDLTRLESLPRASELEPSAQQALRSPKVAGIEDLSQWRILERPEDRVTIGKPLSAAEGEAARYTEETPNFQAITIMSKPSGGDGAYGWWFVSNTSCELRRSFDGLSAADVWLDPEHPAPKPGDTVVHLRVSERACASGEPAGDRVKVAELVRSADELRIAIGIEPQDGAFRCPGNPREPFTVELDEPLGQQQLLDSAVYPPRPFARYREGEG